MPGITVRVEAIPGRASFPLTSTVTSPPVNPLAGFNPWTVSAAVSKVVNPFFIPAGAAGSIGFATAVVPLQELWASISVPSNVQAFVAATATPGGFPTGVVIGVPQIEVFFGNSVTGFNQNLQSGGTYSTPQASISFPVHYVAMLAAPANVTMLVQAWLYARFV